MTWEQIETYLAVVNRGSISAAASALFVSQSTASSRIQLLEQELGAPLLLRHKGQKGVELTPFGRAFVPVANQWASLWRDTQKLSTGVKITQLNIASVDAVNNFTFVPLYNRFVDANPDITLSIATHHSNEIHSLVEVHAADIGYVYRQIKYPNLVSRPVYRELMYLLCRSDAPYGDGIAPEDLPAEAEVFLSWGPDYQIWHERHWNPEIHPLVEVNTGSMLQHYLTRPERWAIAPMSVVQELMVNSSLTYHAIASPPPPRICYEVTSRYPRTSRIQAIGRFQAALTDYIHEDKDICTFQSWMAERS